MEDAAAAKSSAECAAVCADAAAFASSSAAADDLGSRVAHLSLSESASSDDDNDAGGDSESWCSETESSDNNESPEALPANGGASSERDSAGVAAVAPVASQHRTAAATGTTAKATNDLDAPSSASGHPAPLTAEPSAAASATGTLTKVPRVRRALGASCGKTSKLALARVDLPPLRSKNGGSRREAEREPSARGGASREGDIASSSSDSSSSDSDDGGNASPADDADRGGSGRASGRSAATSAAAARTVTNGGGVRHRSTVSSRETGDASSSSRVDSVTVSAAAPPLRGILGRKKDRSARGERSETATRPAANGRGGSSGGSSSSGYTDSLALNIRLRKRPFSLVSRQRTEPPGNKPPSCLQKRQFVTFRKRHTVRDVKFDRDGSILLSTRRSVQRYDANGHYVEQLFVDRVVEPYGLWVSSVGSGHVLVADHREDVVKEFAASSSGSWSSVRSYGPVSAPRGVAQSATGYVIVCAGEGHGVATRCVAVFHRHGQLHAVLGESKLRLPTHVTLTDSLVVVSDHARIVGFDTSGRRAFVYGAGTWHDYPASICADADGFIVATDYYQNAVCALRRDRDRAHIVMDEMHGLRHPALAALSPFGHLLVVGERHSRGFVLKIFKLAD